MILPNTNKLTFLRLVEGGKINLYELLIRDSKSSTIYWYAGKDDQPLIEVDDSRFLHSKDKFHQNLSALLADNETALQEYKQQFNFNFKTVKKLIHFYNTGELIRS